MRILVASLESPTPVRNGASLRLFHVLDQLRLRHELHVVSYGERIDLSGVESTMLAPPRQPSAGARILQAARSLASEPALVHAAREGRLPAAVRKLATEQPFDVAHLSGAAAALLADDLNGLPSLWDSIDTWHVSRAEEARADALPRSLLRRAGSLSIRRFERNALRRVRVAAVTSSTDRAALLAIVPTARVEVVPNGVDAAYFAPRGDVARDPMLVAFHGNLDYSPNADAARFLAVDVLPLVTAQLPAARLRLIGRNPPRAIRQLAASNVEVTGAVEDVRPLLAEAAVVACAVRTGTGIKNKLLEAAALGLPIVATTSALGDLDLRDGEQLLVRDNAGPIAAAVAELLGDQQRGAALGAAARAAVAEHWTWARAAGAFERLYEEIRV